ncbi:hypothetical protein EUX98_g2415 [Antrodiella citrinella]|uniref:DUF6534 domain-containing protein n=1 Tax=Antrodiella citrinella TaxID=2447956 RepID=A0A4S4MZ11_9APHY|nr:hypothetical protein EUX98_g2415 [Antrodiella citrinella]
MSVKTFDDITKHLWHIGTAIALTTFTDLVVTAYFCYVAHRARDGLPGTDTLVNKLIAYGINTGFVTVYALKLTLI